MGTCTSTARHRHKLQQQPQPNRPTSKSSLVFDIDGPPPLPPLPSASFANQQRQRSQSIFTDFDLLSPAVLKPIFPHTDTNSLIQFYSVYSNANNNNNNNNNHFEIVDTMSSSSSSTVHTPARIPVPRTRLPTYHAVHTGAPISLPPRDPTRTLAATNSLGSARPMSITNRAPPPTTMQTRFGFIPRPALPAGQAVQPSTYASRSRSISPTSTTSANSASSASHVSQRLAKTQTLTTATTPTRRIPAASTAKVIPSPRPRDSSLSKPTVKSTLQSPTSASLLRSRTPSRTSTASPTSSVASSLPTTAAVVSAPPPPPPAATVTTKSDISAIRDRYKTQQRMNFFARRTPISTANGSPVAGSMRATEPLTATKEKKLPAGKLSIAPYSSDASKSITPPQSAASAGDSGYGKVPSPSSHRPSAHLSQSSKHRQRAVSMLSSASALSNALNQEVLLEDDNCSLKSDDLMCDYDDTLTIDSLSKNDERTDSCSSTSLANEPNRKQSASKEHRSTAAAKASTATNDKLNGSLRDTLDELNRLSNRMENGAEHEHPRRIPTRSVSLKPPTSYLPPLEDAELITMDVESYRQVMKDVMVVKTVLHQLDRLLKQSDGANMTDSMIGSFHEFHDSVFSARRYSTSTEGTVRNSIDENSSYDDLLKEIVALRKEKEQDKQTIKLLQEQMYKYSSQANS